MVCGLGGFVVFFFVWWFGFFFLIVNMTWTKKTGHIVAFEMPGQ